MFLHRDILISFDLQYLATLITEETILYLQNIFYVKSFLEEIYKIKECENEMIDEPEERTSINQEILFHKFPLGKVN